MRMANNPPAVVMKAFTWAYEELQLTALEASQLLGVSEKALKETSLVGFESTSDESEIQIAFIRMYHLLYAMSDGDTGQMIGWFNRHNPHLGAIPKDACHNLAGINYISDYLESEQKEKPVAPPSFMIPGQPRKPVRKVAVRR